MVPQLVIDHRLSLFVLSCRWELRRLCLYVDLTRRMNETVTQREVVSNLYKGQLSEVRREG